MKIEVFSIQSGLAVAPFCVSPSQHAGAKRRDTALGLINTDK
jgi:hypothetical protein